LKSQSNTERKSIRQKIYRSGAIGRTGKGDFGHGLDTAYQGVSNVELVAVVDENPQGLKQAGERTGAKQLYSDYESVKFFV
jgi:predicted dehydrogenase